MPAVIERPKMSQKMWNSLKAHIMRERKRKKEEQEADAEEERRRREREHKQKQSIMTLDETKEQLAQLQKKLSELTDEKHELFIRLKKVLHEDDNNKRKQMNKENNEVYGISTNFQANHIPMGGTHPHMFMQGGNQLRNSAMHKVNMPSQAPGLTAGVKRQRSPSPPPVSYHHNYKAPGIPVYPTKHGPYATTQPSPYYAQTAVQTSHHHMRGHPSHMQTMPTSSGIACATVSQPQGHLANYPSFRTQFPPNSAPPDSKHLHPGYHLQALPQAGIAYAGLLQQHLDQAGQKPGFPDERLYIPQAGNLTSGYPVHVVHSSPSPFQSKPSSNPPVAHGSTVQQHSINPPPSSRFY